MVEDRSGRRLELLDTIRGIMLVSMICYHAAWNMVYIYGVNWKWYKSGQAYAWQQSICWTFILLSGFCFSLGKRHWKNGMIISLAGILVTLVTIVVMPQNRVVFGVLTCIGACILVVSLIERFLGKIHPWVGLLGAFSCFLFTKNINYGYLGIGTVRLIEIQKSQPGNYGAAFLGIPFAGFVSTDYFSLIPWLFLFITGFYLHKIFKRYELMKLSFMKWKFPVFSFLGRHSLLVYLIHQPLIYGIQELYFFYS